MDQIPWNEPKFIKICPCKHLSKLNEIHLKLGKIIEIDPDSLKLHTFIDEHLTLNLGEIPWNNTHKNSAKTMETYLLIPNSLEMYPKFNEKSFILILKTSLL